MSMNWVEVTDKSTGFTRKLQYATNSGEGGGLFLMKNGAYSQLMGNGQTPAFKTKESFKRYVKEMHPEGIITDSSPWD